MFNGKLSSSKYKKILKYLKDELNNNCGYMENKNYFFCYQSSNLASGFASKRLIEWQRVADIFNN